MIYIQTILRVAYLEAEIWTEKPQKGLLNPIPLNSDKSYY